MFALTAKLQAILVASGTFLATAGLAWLLHSFDVSRIELQHAMDMNGQKTALQESCKQDKAITTETSHDYQQKIATLTDQLAAVKRVQPSRCLMPAARATPRCHDAAGGGKSAEQDGVDTDTLYDFAGEAERYRLRLIACQSFIERTWRVKAQE